MKLKLPQVTKTCPMCHTDLAFKMANGGEIHFTAHDAKFCRAAMANRILTQKGIIEEQAIRMASMKWEYDLFLNRIHYERTVVEAALNSYMAGYDGTDIGEKALRVIKGDDDES